MSDTFTISYPAGSTLYVSVYDLTTDQVRILAAVDNGDGTYTATMPADAPLGAYVCRVYKQIGASPDTAVDTVLHPGETRIWDGQNFNFDTAVNKIISPYNKGLTFEEIG